MIGKHYPEEFKIEAVVKSLIEASVSVMWPSGLDISNKTLEIELNYLVTLLPSIKRLLASRMNCVN